MFNPLDLAGHLDIFAGGDPIAVEFRGDVIEVRFPSFRGAWALRRRLGRARLRAWLPGMQDALARADVELHIRVGRRRVGRLAGDSRTTRLAAWLGIDPIEIDPWVALRARSRRPEIGPPTQTAPEGTDP